MRTLIGLMLVIISCIGTLFFRRYSGTAIAHTTLWHIGFIALGLAGVVIVTMALNTSKRKIEEDTSNKIEEFNQVAELIELDFDQCEFRNGTFNREVEKRDTGLILAAGLVGSSAGELVTPVISERVIQSYLIYTHLSDGGQERFVSQAFPFDETTLKFHVLNNSIKLYANRNEDNKYYFELKK